MILDTFALSGFQLWGVANGKQTSSPDWLMKKHTSSRNTGVFLSRKSLDSSTMTGSSVSSSSI